MTPPALTGDGTTYTISLTDPAWMSRGEEAWLQQTWF